MGKVLDEEENDMDTLTKFTFWPSKELQVQKNARKLGPFYIPRTYSLLMM